METKIIKVKIPAGFNSYEDAVPYEIEDGKVQGNPLLFAYWYGTGDYCGTGDAIYQCFDGKWDHMAMGHCSCNGPLEGGVSTSGVYGTLDELVSTFSDELKAETAGIVEGIRASNA